MDEPLVSVVIPAYNRAASIADAIASVATQDYENLEIVLVDDASSDGTAEAVAGLGIPALRYFRHPENLGANAARNTGIREARGEYVAFQDSDDVWDSRKLSRQLQALRDHGADICFCAFDRAAAGVLTRIPKPGYGVRPGCRDRYEELLRGSYISCQTLVVRRDLLFEVGLFDEALPRLQDWELCLRLAKRHPLVYLQEPLVRVDISDDSISRQFPKLAAAANMVLEKHAAEFRRHPEAAAMLCFNVGLEAVRHGRAWSALGFLSRGVWLGGTRFPGALLALYRRR